MMNAGWQRVDYWVRTQLPTLIVFLLVILTVLPVNIPSYSSVAPSMVLMAVFYWVLHRPDLLSAVSVFLIGLFHGALTGEPIGVQSFLLLSAYWFTGSQRRFFLGKSFLFVWWGFAVIAAMVAILQWILISLILGDLVTPKPALFSFLETAALYPLLAWAFARVQRFVPQVA